MTQELYNSKQRVAQKLPPDERHQFYCFFLKGYILHFFFFGCKNIWKYFCCHSKGQKILLLENYESDLDLDLDIVKIPLSFHLLCHSVTFHECESILAVTLCYWVLFNGRHFLWNKFLLWSSYNGSKTSPCEFDFFTIIYLQDFL